MEISESVFTKNLEWAQLDEHAAIEAVRGVPLGEEDIFVLKEAIKMNWHVEQNIRQLFFIRQVIIMKKLTHRLSADENLLFRKLQSKEFENLLKSVHGRALTEEEYDEEYDE